MERDLRLPEINSDKLSPFFLPRLQMPGHLQPGGKMCFLAPVPRIKGVSPWQLTCCLATPHSRVMGQWGKHMGCSRALPCGGLAAAFWQLKGSLAANFHPDHPRNCLHECRVTRGGIQPRGPPRPASQAILGASAQHPPPRQARTAPCTGLASLRPLWRRPDSAGPFLSDQRLMVALGGTAELGMEG